MFGGGFDKAIDGGEKFWLVEQEGIMAAIGFNFNKRNIGRVGGESVDDLPAFPGGEEPIAGEGDDAEAGFCLLKGFGQYAAMLSKKVKIIHGAGDVEIGIGVKAVHKAEALMAQIAFHLKVGVKAEGDLFALL